MKKHIIGLALFSFIVSTAAVIYALFPVPEIAPVSEVITVSQNDSTNLPTSCWKMRKGSNFDSAIIKQAVFNLDTKQFSWELVKQKVDSPFDFHFFVKDEKGTRYVGTEQDKNSVNYRDLHFSGSFVWTGNLDSYANLYVIAEPSAARGYKKRQPTFDANKATAVSLDYGK